MAQYNQELEKLGTSTWLNVPWLYSECYLYRYFWNGSYSVHRTN